ncbi:MAG: phosphopantetheine-binding protein [Prevotellaceae bacterium]|jgi:acyl carrier protein|nr:phosphopantetheine-binding protein [Prevotellaceae bacterium]
MEKAEIISKINAVLADEFEVEQDEFLPGASLMQTLDLDSLDLVDMVVLIEQHFGILVKGSDFANIKTFQDFYDFLDAKLQ